MEYYMGIEGFPYSITFVTGASRSGKSLFSRLMSSAENIEWLFEPYAVYMPAVLASIGQLDEKFAFGMMRDACRELIHDRILLRNANFRPGDMSSIYHCKDAQAIFKRLMEFNTHEDVEKYISQHEVSIILDIPKDSLPIDVMRRAFPDAKFVHIVRNGFDVASAAENKGWFSLDYINKRKSYGIVYRKCACQCGKDYLVPEWLPVEKEQEFISTTDYGRGIMYWSCQLQSIEDRHGCFDLEIKYEEMVSKPEVILTHGKSLLRAKWTSKTISVMEEFNTNECDGKKRILNDLSEEEKKCFYKQMRRYGYEY